MFKKARPLTEADAIEIPPIGLLSPRFEEIVTKRVELGKESSALRAEDIRLSIEAGPDDGAAREARIAEILGQPVPKVTTPRSERRRKIASRLRDIEDASGTLMREKDTERNRATALLRDRLAPEYKRQVRALIDALIFAHTAQVAIRGLVSRVEDAGYNTGWMDAHPCRWLDVGPNGNIGRFVDEKRAAGLIDARDIPADLLS